MAKIKLDIQADPTETITTKRATISVAQLLAACGLPLDAEVIQVNANGSRVLTEEDSFLVSFVTKAVRKPRAVKVKA